MFLKIVFKNVLKYTFPEKEFINAGGSIFILKKWVWGDCRFDFPPTRPSYYLTMTSARKQVGPVKFMCETETLRRASMHWCFSILYI